MDIGQIKPKEITQELQESYLDYAMSVIISRALPDVRDGLKPVHRRILYAMWDMGLRPGAKFRKSATVVGEVLGKYHPHGDAPVYDALVRMVQDFSLRYPLIDGQGNFGSLDGDKAAAMRYSECRLALPSQEMLQGLEKETVDWVDNYDGTRQEPTVLPAKLPNLLINGSMGIAVGMATNIPPHNLTEVCEAIIYLIDNPKAATQDLLKFIKGPDFPTGGAIYDSQAIVQAYSTGKGAIVTRATAQVIEAKKENWQIIISEIPFQVNKASLLERIAELVKEKKLEGVKDIRDESDKEGIRVVVELKIGTYPQKILNRLYKLTDLQRSFYLNMLALVDGLQPQTLSLKDILEQYIVHRREVVRRCSEFDLARAKERAHILQGLKKAISLIDAVIIIIKKSSTKEVAHKNLCQKFKFTAKQATAILEMRLQALAGLERHKIEDELKEKLKLIKELAILLGSPQKISQVIKKELLELRQKYGDERRTKVYASPVGQFKEEDLIPEEDCIITLTHGGYIKRINPKTYRAQRRGGKGILGIATREADWVEHLHCVSTHDNLLFFTNDGLVFKLKAYEIPETSRVARGQAIVNFLQLKTNQRVTAIIALGNSASSRRKTKDRYLVMATSNGIIKKVPEREFVKVRCNGLIAIKLQKGDELNWAELSSGDDEILLVTRLGQAIRFKEKDVRPMGRSAAGVRGIRLKKPSSRAQAEVKDNVISLDVVARNLAQRAEVLVLAENGYGKRTELKNFKVQKRAGSGIKVANVSSKTGEVVIVKVLDKREIDLLTISEKGQVIRTPLKSISLLGRATQGVRIMKLEPGDKVASATSL